MKIKNVKELNGVINDKYYVRVKDDNIIVKERNESMDEVGRIKTNLRKDQIINFLGFYGFGIYFEIQN